MKKKVIFNIGILLLLAFQLNARCLLCFTPGHCEWTQGLCAGSGASKAQMLCFDYNQETGQLTQGRVKVLVDDQNNGMVQDGDRYINILPDFLDSLFRSNKLEDKYFNGTIKINRFVSNKRIKLIADELGVNVTKVKKLPKPNYCPSCEEEEKKKKAQEKATINPFESVIIEMVCDCNPSQVLNTFVTDANGVVNITVPKDANYSFKLVMPPMLKEKGIKIADLASDVLVNFTGAKNVENLSFNNKGVAAAKNLQQGNYEMALSRKPPKGGPSGPPRGKCPPGQIPWCGGCIPSDVVKGLNKVACPVGTVMTPFGCVDIKTPGSEPEIPRPDGFPSPKKAVAINCPSGKYDANGNCIFASPSATKNTAMKFSVFSIDAGYLGSANATNNKCSKPLFAGSGLSAGLNYRYGAKWGIAGRIGYAGGSRNESNLNEFASTLTQTPWVYKTSGFTKTWSQFNFSAGPCIFLGKNYKGEISVVGGVSMGSVSKLKIDLYDANTFYKNVYDVTEKKVKPFWEVGGSYRVVTGKKMTLGLKASYGANGGTIGINITSFCVQCCCQKGDLNCCANMPKSSKIIEN